MRPRRWYSFHQGFTEHLLEHVFLHLCGINVVVAALLHLFLLLLYAFLKFHVINFLTVYFRHSVVVGEQFARAVNRREDEQQESHTQD